MDVYRKDNFNTSKKKKQKFLKECFKIDLRVTLHLLYADQHPMKFTPLKDYSHVHFSYTVDCVDRNVQGSGCQANVEKHLKKPQFFYYGK